MAGKYQLSKPRQFHDPTFSPAPGLAIALLPNGKQALTSGLDFQLRLWDLEKGKCIQSWDARGPLNSITLDSKGTTALLGAVQGIVCWDLENWQLGKDTNLWSHSEITTVALAEKTNILLGASEDTTIHRWNFSTGEKLDSLVGHKITVTDLALDQTGELALSSDVYGEIRLWDLPSGTCMRSWQGHEGSISTLDLSPDGRWALSGSQDGTLILWDLQRIEAVRTLAEDWLYDIVLLTDISRVYTASDAGISLWDLKQGKLLDKFEETRIIALSLSPEEDLLAALVKNNQLLTWSIQPGI